MASFSDFNESGERESGPSGYTGPQFGLSELPGVSSQMAYLYRPTRGNPQQHQRQPAGSLQNLSQGPTESRFSNQGPMMPGFAAQGSAFPNFSNHGLHQPHLGMGMYGELPPAAALSWQNYIRPVFPPLPENLMNAFGMSTRSFWPFHSGSPFSLPSEASPAIPLSAQPPLPYDGQGLYSETPTVSKGNPATHRGNTSICTGTTPIIKGNPAPHRGNTSIGTGTAPITQGNPATHRGNKSVGTGTAPISKGNTAPHRGDVSVGSPTLVVPTENPAVSRSDPENSGRPSMYANHNLPNGVSIKKRKHSSSINSKSPDNLTRYCIGTSPAKLPLSRSSLSSSSSSSPLSLTTTSPSTEETAEEKLAKKRAQNRIAAKKCYNKKLMKIAHLETDIQQLAAVIHENDRKISALQGGILGTRGVIQAHVSAGCMSVDILRTVDGPTCTSSGMP